MLIRKLLVVASLSPFISLAQPNANNLSGADPLNAITTAMPFLGINADSRSGAMGDAGTALSPNANSMFWNTAMLNFSKDKSEIGLSYVPWLRQLTNDIHLSYLAGYYRFGRHVVGGSLRYFSLGEITFTSNDGSVIRKDKPSEFELGFGYAFKLSDRSSIGVNGKFAYSNLTGGLVVEGSQTKAGVAGIADISYAFRNEDIRWFGINGVYAFGVNIQNIGNKIQYSQLARRDFLPQALKIGNAYTAKIDKYNSITLSIDIQKLLVPTPAIYDATSGELISGKPNDVGVIAGMVQSFYDAPGTPLKDENGDYIQNSDGTYQLKKGSRFKEELREYNIGSGVEYWYNNLFALRGGYFHEAYTKGGRQFFTAGFGLQYNMFSFDFSYLMSLKRNSPLANTLRFSIRFKLGDNGNKVDESKPE